MLVRFVGMLVAIGLVFTGTVSAQEDTIRVYASASQRFADFDTMVAELAEADVVFVGEAHDDPETHRLELRLLEALFKKRPTLVVSLEMFERDVQGVLDAYLAGSLSEEKFLEQSRPWKNYATDYRSLVEFDRANRLPVIAGNVPRRIASKVATGKGLSELGGLAPADAGLVATDVFAPRDGYWRRFREAMREHGGASADEQAFAFYQSQCVKDDTMAESIARHIGRSRDARPLVVHYAGSFHSDYAEGTVLRTRRRAPSASIAVVSAIPVEQLGSADGKTESGKGDFVVFCRREPKK